MTSCFFNVEEMHSINYGIDILNEPMVWKDENIPGGSVLLKSKYGQDYYCSFPENVENDKQKEEEEKAALKVGVVELLKPLETGPCLFKAKDWWSYEFCFGKHIRQYHVEDGMIKGEISFLGVYESDFDWDNQANKDQRAKSKSSLNHYHSQYYTNGSRCDLTGKPRQTEVRFICEEDASDYIVRIDEPETCSYILTVHTNRICQHPYLKPLTQPRPVPVKCNPLLSQQQYQEYQDQLAEIRMIQQEIENKNEMLKTLSSQMDEHSKLSGKSVNSDQESTPVQDEELEKKRVSVQVDEIVNGAAGEHINIRMKAKIIDSAEDLQTFLNNPLGDLFEDDNTGKDSELPTPTSEDSDKDGNTKLSAGSDTTVEFQSHDRKQQPDESAAIKDGDHDSERDHEEVFDDYKKEITEIRKSFQNRREELASVKNKVWESVQNQMDDIIKEAEDEVGVGLEMDRKATFKQLADTLNQLIGKLEDTEKDIGDVDKSLEEMANQMNPPTDSQGDLSNSKGREAAVESASPKGPDTEAIDDRIKVHVRKVNKVEQGTKGSRLSDEQREGLERSVQEGLENAGLSTKHQKVHVKIITAGYYDKDDDSIHVLSGEDTAAFKNMIVAILGGNGEASKEESRHQQMEENYRFVFSKRQSSLAQEQLPSSSQTVNTVQSSATIQSQQQGSLDEEREE